MKITRTAKELRSQSPAHHHQTWRTLRSAILCAELYEALRGGEKVVTVTESAERGETHDVYKVEIQIEDLKPLTDMVRTTGVLDTSLAEQKIWRDAPPIKYCSCPVPHFSGKGRDAFCSNCGLPPAR